MTEKFLKAVKKHSPIVWRKTLERKRLNGGINKGRRSKISPENSENPIISNTPIQVDNLSEDDNIVRLKKENSDLKANLEKAENKLAIALFAQNQERRENSELLRKWRNEESINVGIRKQYHDLKDVLQKIKDKLVIEQNKHQKEVKLITKESEKKDKISHNKLTTEKKEHKKVKEKLKNKRVKCREIKEQLDDEKEAWEKQEFKLETEIEELKKKITEKENTIFHLTEENSDLQEILTNQQAEINDLATNLTNITNQKNTLQTEKDNLQIELQNKDNELNSQRANFELERERKNKKITNLKTQLQDKNSENKALEQEIKNIQVKLEKNSNDYQEKEPKIAKEVLQTIIKELNLTLLTEEISVEKVITEIKSLIIPQPQQTPIITVSTPTELRENNHNLLVKKDQEITYLREQLNLAKSKQDKLLLVILLFSLLFLLVIINKLVVKKRKGKLNK